MILNRGLFLIIGVTTVLLFALGFFAMKPSVSKIAGHYKELKANQLQLQEIEEERSLLLNLQKDKKEINEIYQRALYFLPQKPEEGIFAAQWEKIAQDTNQERKKIVITESSTKETTTTKPTTIEIPASVKEVSFELTQKGTFPEFLKFLKTLENSSRLPSLQSLVLTVSSSDKNQLDCQIKGIIYYKSDLTISDELANLKMDSSSNQKLKNLNTIITIPSEVSGGRTNPFVPF